MIFCQDNTLLMILRCMCFPFQCDFAICALFIIALLLPCGFVTQEANNSVYIKRKLGDPRQGHGEMLILLQSNISAVSLIPQSLCSCQCSAMMQVHFHTQNLASTEMAEKLGSNINGQHQVSRNPPIFVYSLCVSWTGETQEGAAGQGQTVKPRAHFHQTSKRNPLSPNVSGSIVILQTQTFLLLLFLTSSFLINLWLFLLQVHIYSLTAVPV